MNIVTTTITKTAVLETKNGELTFDYTIINGNLSRVQATVRDLKKNEFGEKPVLGYINCEHGNVTLNISESAKISLLLADFENALAQIRESVEKEKV